MSAQKLLLNWFAKNQRPLPWRQRPTGTACRARPTQTQPSQAQPSQAWPSQAQPSQAQPSQAQSSQAQSSQAWPAHAQINGAPNAQKRPTLANHKQRFYRVWVSEVMLQQTTSQAVIPYYKNFLKRFPSLRALAQAPQSQVLAAWSGLGYYSRAKNLHKAAQLLAQQKQWPRRYEELMAYPSFGPYTARAVSSLVYGQAVGVLDGNVIRVLSRKHALALKWWQPAARRQLQHLADQEVQGVNSAQMNQALMELGATICLPQKPKCVLCPWLSHCQAQKKDLVHKLPLAKAKVPKQMWLWRSQIKLKKGSVPLLQNTQTPFLKGQWVPPSQARRIDKKPKHYNFCHSVTNYQIFVQVRNTLPARLTKATKWVPLSKIKQVSPTSFVSKQIKCLQNLT